MTKSVRVAIRGSVQGVGYRAWARDRASSLGLSGWVRNRRSGEVEAVFSGPADQVDRMLDAAAEGPAAARVRSVEILDDAAPVEGAFELRPTE